MKRKISDKELLDTIEGRLFYSLEYQSWLVVFKGDVYRARMDKFIKKPTHDQICILNNDLVNYTDFCKTKLVTEELLSELEKIKT